MVMVAADLQPQDLVESKDDEKNRRFLFERAVMLLLYLH